MRDLEEDTCSGSVLMAMSGGVDSSVAAIVLLQEGYEVEGATMCLIGDIDDDRALSSTDIEDAKDCAERIGIIHHVFDMREDFDREVISEFCTSYIEGMTPNPCISCNRRIKFGSLAAKRDAMGLDYLATGHYAVREFDVGSERFVLKKGADANKDQSYVLAFLSQAELAKTLFPLGGLSKTEVRKIAAASNLRSAHKEESQDICFIKDGKYAEFIEGRLGVKPEAGPIIDESGKRVGEHDGLFKYTIGQRKGLGIAAPYPLYVVAKDFESNSIVVGPKESLMTTEVSASDANLVTYEIGEVAGKTLKAFAKTHYRHIGEDCEAVFDRDGGLKVVFDNPVTKPASGQTLVVYEDDVVIGAGIIK